MKTKSFLEVSHAVVPAYGACHGVPQPRETHHLNLKPREIPTKLNDRVANREICLLQNSVLRNDRNEKS